MDSVDSTAYVTPETIRRWNQRGDQVFIVGRRLRCIVLGETHDVEQQIFRQLSLIEAIRPKFVLHEFGAAWTYCPPAGMSLQINRPIEEGYDTNTRQRFPEPLRAQAEQLGHSLVGIDMTQRETENAYRRLALARPDEYSWSPLLSLTKKKYPEYKFTIVDPLTMELRDDHMIESIKEWERKSDRPLVIVVGSKHAQNFHERGLLRARGLTYAVIIQRWYRGYRTVPHPGSCL